jgi:hypothetical protein
MGQLHNILETDGREQALLAFDAEPVHAALRYLSDEDSTLGFTYSGWAHCILPHRAIAAGEAWQVVSDRMRLVVEPGLKPGPNDTLLPMGVPYGAMARLILIYLQSEALRTGSREIALGSNMTAWMRRIGVPDGGKSRRNVLDQADRLSRCRMSFHMTGQGGGQGLVQQNIVDRALFIQEGGRQGSLSLETTKLSEGFFEQLQRHPVPLEEAAIRALSNNSAALDVYIWLAYRLRSLKAGKFITWAALKAQFGQSYGQLRHFKAKFPPVLEMALAVYPSARLDYGDAGVTLHPSSSPVLPRPAR